MTSAWRTRALVSVALTVCGLLPLCWGQVPSVPASSAGSGGPQFIADLNARKPLAGGGSVLFLKPVQALPVVVDGVPGASTVKAEGSFYIPLQVGILTISKDSMADLRGLVEQVRADCGDGELRREPVSVPSFMGKPAVTDASSDVNKAGLVGDFRCIQGGETVFRVRIQGVEDDLTPTLFPPGWKWAVNVSVMGRDYLRSKIAQIREEQGLRDQAAQAYKKQAEQMRAKLASGAQVSVRSSDLPANVADEIRKRYYGADDHMICALVIDMKPSLAQIQVGSTLLFVPVDKLYPAGTPTTSSSKAAVRLAAGGVLPDQCLK